jgi:hypothetical protein
MTTQDLMPSKIRKKVFLFCSIFSFGLIIWNLFYSMNSFLNPGPWFLISFIILLFFTIADALTQPTSSQKISLKFGYKVAKIVFLVFVYLFAIIGFLSSIYLLLVFTRFG